MTSATPARSALRYREIAEEYAFVLDQAGLAYEVYDWKAARKAYAEKHKLKVPVDKDEAAAADKKKK